MADSTSGIPEQLRQIANAIKKGDFAQEAETDKLLWQAYRNGEFKRDPILQFAADRQRAYNVREAAPDVREWNAFTLLILDDWGPSAIPGFLPSYDLLIGASEAEWYAIGLHALADYLCAAQFARAAVEDQGGVLADDPQEKKWDHVWQIIVNEKATKGIGTDQKIANAHNKSCAKRINDGTCEKIDAEKVAQIRYEYNHLGRHSKQNHKKRS